MLGALFSPNGRDALLVALTASLDLFICAKDLFVVAILRRSPPRAAAQRACAALARPHARRARPTGSVLIVAILERSVVHGAMLLSSTRYPGAVIVV